MERRRRAGKPRQDNRFQMVATTLEGLEKALAKELQLIGGNDIRTGKRAVYFSADQDLVYKANLRLRTALRILKPLKKFRAENEDDLYDGIASIDWTEIFDVDKSFAIKTAVSGRYFTHSHFAALKCKDAIVDQFREKLNERPSIETREPDLVFHVKIHRDQVTVSLDSSGVPLNKRGYRQPRAIAPLNECLAAGMLMIAGYEGKRNFVDGMCGSGTICVEAALIANKIAPGLLREDFAFMHWKDFDSDLYEIIHNATVNRIKDSGLQIMGYDRSMASVKLARKAAEAAGVDEAINFRITDFFDEDPPEAPGILVMNPPYGERIKIRDIEVMYNDIGDKFKQAYPGYQAWLLSGHEEAMKSVGLRTFDTHHLVNGKIDCRFSGYRIYSGKKV
ncbi:MAG: THUMP domain-containing protein [Bacteroidota bacterium]